MTRALLVAAIVLVGAAARADDTPPVAAQAEAGADASKVECLQHHETAQILRRGRRLLEARAALQACSRAACPGPIRSDCIDWLEQVGRSLPSLVVTASARGADLANVRVFIDGKLVAARLNGSALEIDPGEHQFRFESPPWPPVEGMILVSEGVKGRPIDAEFAPPSPATEIRTPPVLDYILGGIALASLGTFAYFGASALYDRQQLDQRCAPFCRQDEVNPVRMKLIVADTALGVAVTSLAVGLYLRAVRPVGSRRSRTLGVPDRGLSAVVMPTGQGARIQLGAVF